MRRHVATMITGSRIICSMGLMFFPVSSVPFLVLYLLCGLSDMTDGFAARKTGTASEFGAKLDTAADGVFAAAALIKVLPAAQIPCWAWIWIAGIAAIKLWNLTAGFVRRKKFEALHTKMNKATGLILFLWPLTLPFLDVKYSCAAVCAIATAAAVLEGYDMRTGRETA